MIKFLDIKKITDSYQPEIGKVLEQVVDSGFFIRGKEVKNFEDAYARFTGSTHCVGVGNGFDALRLIFRAWLLSGVLREQDEIIVPANTYIASVLALTENRLTPLFIEPDINSYNIDPGLIEEKITARTKAIMLVHLYGQNAMHPEINSIAVRYRLKIIEDNAQAAGCFAGARRTGSLGDAAAHSFFPTKNLGALGDAGAVTTDDAALASAVRTLGNYGASKKGINDLPGVNSRLDEMQAAVLNLKLMRLDEDNAQRRKAASYYLKHINNPNIILPEPMVPAKLEHVWHLFVVRCIRRDDLQQYLTKNGIETLIHYPIPPHRQLAYKEMNHLTFPITERIHREVLSLPMSPVMEEEDLRRIVEVVNGFMV
ncbi:MAG: DegT/DnrJ/EryC1/StrS family aminotransferase [Cyclobacteriaceae bacterium]